MAVLRRSDEDDHDHDHDHDQQRGTMGVRDEEL
jgi:hypothetical protein